VIREVKEEHERLMKQRESKQRRAATMARRGGGGGADEESVFLLGLEDCCPRCGEFFGRGLTEEDKREHLRNCTDEAAHVAHAKAKKKNVENEAKKESAASKQAGAQAKATWEVLGGRTDQLWLLDTEQLRAMAKDAGEDSTGERMDLVSRIAAQRDGASSATHAIMSGSAKQTAGKGVPKRRKLTADSLPSNLQSLSLDQLQCACAAHGFIPKGTCKADVLKEIEAELDSDAPLMLKGGDGPARPASSDEDSSEEYQASSDDEDVKLSKRKRKATSKKQTGKRPAPKQEPEDSESDDVKLSKRKRKPTAKVEVVQIADSSDEDEDKPLSSRKNRAKKT